MLRGLAVSTTFAGLSTRALGDSHTQALPFETAAPDGTTLRGHVHFRTDVETPVPVVLVMSPYWNNADTASEDAPNHADNGPIIQRLIDEGYAVAAISVRGTGDSQGCFQFGGKIEQDDPDAVIQALANEPYCNGNVGMLGFSYDGFPISWALAGDEPEALEAVVPIDGIVDYWNLMTWNGAPFSVQGPIMDPVFYGQSELSPTDDPQALIHRVGCGHRAEHATASAQAQTSGAKTEWHEERDFRADVFDSDIPMFVTNSIRAPAVPDDIMSGPVGSGHILQIRDLYENRPEDSTRMLLGQWGHSYPDTDDYFRQVVTWFDHYLRDYDDTPPNELPSQGRGKAKGLAKHTDDGLTGVVEYEDDRGEWHTADQWPPTDETATLYLSNDELVLDEDAVESSARSFQSDDTGPSLGETCTSQMQVLYRSAPVTAGVRLAGEFTLRATLESTLDGGNLMATLFRTTGDGTCGDNNAVEVARMPADLRHWEELGEPRPFPTNEPVEIEFSSFPLATQLQEGERLVLGISGGSPTLMPDERKPQLTIHTGGDTTSHVELPVADGKLTL